ncbi:MAG TPA: long-chain fatty acid--CoA ligase [Candidatus Kryptonia bacterium]|nr:long-chain fatty acid--CoA ligase [Candidatus Kryptonia bacterium]
MHLVHDAVLHSIVEGEDDFDTLALTVFAHQFESVAMFRRYCERRHCTPTSVRTWRDIPPVPVSAFKETDLCCAPPERVFRTTGTTRGSARRGRHALPDLRLYRASALAGLRRFLFPDVEQMPIISAIPSAADAPDSSLSQMVAWTMEEVGDSTSRYVADSRGIDYERCVAALRTSERSGAPICLMATSAALLHLLDYCAAHELTFRLPHGTRLMDTGGPKGAPRPLSRTRPLSRNGLLHACWNTFAIPGYFCVNEYGMAELSSQFYENVIANRVDGRFAHRCLIGPPWTRVRVLDPATLDDARQGEPGLLCFYDLANAGTVSAVLSEDIGRLVHYGFEILGRASGAETRGCSLTAAEWAEAKSSDAVSG